MVFAVAVASTSTPASLDVGELLVCGAKERVEVAVSSADADAVSAAVDAVAAAAVAAAASAALAAGALRTLLQFLLLFMLLILMLAQEGDETEEAGEAGGTRQAEPDVVEDSNSMSGRLSM